MAEEVFDWSKEEYTASAGGEFIDSKLFKKWLYNDETVFVTGIREGHSKKFDEDQWLVDFVGPDGDEYTKSVGRGNAERDARFRRVLATIEAKDGEAFECRFIEVSSGGSGSPRIDLGPPVS
jgi:hypothetical protein